MFINVVYFVIVVKYKHKIPLGLFLSSFSFFLWTSLFKMKLKNIVRSRHSILVVNRLLEANEVFYGNNVFSDWYYTHYISLPIRTKQEYQVNWLGYLKDQHFVSCDTSKIISHILTSQCLHSNVWPLAHTKRLLIIWI